MSTRQIWLPCTTPVKVPPTPDWPAPLRVPVQTWPGATAHGCVWPLAASPARPGGGKGDGGPHGPAAPCGAGPGAGAAQAVGPVALGGTGPGGGALAPPAGSGVGPGVALGGVLVGCAGAPAPSEPATAEGVRCRRRGSRRGRGRRGG